MGVLGGDLTLAGFDFLLEVVGLDEAGAFSGQTGEQHEGTAGGGEQSNGNDKRFE